MIKRFFSSLRRGMENYKGRHIGCAPGTHYSLVRMILRHMSPSPGVLDLGTHSGALLLRLKDKGFSDLHGADLDSTRFDLEGASFTSLELNQDFSSQFGRQFSLITCTDVIEHLDCPRNFLIQVRNLLSDGGFVAISLPNVGFWEGRIKFLLTGELWGFGAKNYRNQRHISPITCEQMVLMLGEIGLKPIEWGFGGSFDRPIRRALLAPLWLPIRALCGSAVIGESALYLARRSDPDSDLSQPQDYRQRWRGVADDIGVGSESS